MYSSVSFLLLLACGPRTPIDGAPELAGVEAVSEAAAPLSVLEQGASSHDVSTRARALALLLEHGDLERWAPRALYDPSPYVQRAAIDALSLRPEPQALELIESLATRSDVEPYTRGQAGVALHRSGRIGARESLSEAWRAERLHWRRAPLALAAARMGDEEARAVLLEDLARGDYPMEMRFFLDLADSGFEELVPSLVEGSALLEEELQLPVAVALMGLGSNAGESRFREALNGDVEQRLEAIDFLVELDGESSDALLRKARRSGPEASQRYAELALIARGEGGLSPALEALDSMDRELRQQGVWALSCYLASGQATGRGERQALKRLREMVGDPEPVVVLAAVQGLGRAGEPADRALLAALWVEDSPSLSVEVAGAILEIEARDALSELAAL